jgi:Flp pilus assembly protein TadD
LDEGVEALADPEAKGEAEAWLGAALERMERPTEARPHLERATALAPDLPLGWLLLGGHDLAGGRLEKARESLARAQRLDPGNPAPCLALANLVAAEGRYPEVETWTEAALTRAPNDPEMWKAVARFYLERNLRQGENPLWAAEGAVRLAPEDAEALSLLGWARLLEGDATGALEALDGALERDPTLAEAHALRAQALSALGREMEAREAMVRATDLGYRP